MIFGNSLIWPTSLFNHLNKYIIKKHNIVCFIIRDKVTERAKVVLRIWSSFQKSIHPSKNITDFKMSAFDEIQISNLPSLTSEISKLSLLKPIANESSIGSLIEFVEGWFYHIADPLTDWCDEVSAKLPNKRCFLLIEIYNLYFKFTTN